MIVTHCDTEWDGAADLFNSILISSCCLQLVVLLPAAGSGSHRKRTLITSVLTKRIQSWNHLFLPQYRLRLEAFDNYIKVTIDALSLKWINLVWHSDCMIISSTVIRFHSTAVCIAGRKGGNDSDLQPIIKDIFTAACKAVNHSQDQHAFRECWPLQCCHRLCCSTTSQVQKEKHHKQCYVPSSECTLCQGPARNSFKIFDGCFKGSVASTL